jgi:ubiquinone/menaquinone biosynthesis C-methylase UbiE
VIVKAKELLPAIDYKIGDLRKLPWADKSFDCVVSDAVLLYVGPDEIDKTMDEIDRVTRRGVVLVERESDKDEVCSHVWGRNYAKLLEKRGFSVEKIKITPEIWPNSKGWQTYGCIFVATRNA